MKRILLLGLLCLSACQTHTGEALDTCAIQNSSHAVITYSVYSKWNDGTVDQYKIEKVECVK